MYVRAVVHKPSSFDDIGRLQESVSLPPTLRCAVERGGTAAAAVADQSAGTRNPVSGGSRLDDGTICREGPIPDLPNGAAHCAKRTIYRKSTAIGVIA